MIEIKRLKEIYNKVKKEKVIVLECLGVPGSGKSQVIRKLGENFPLFKKDVIIKWHIQCKDSGHNVKQELIKLAEKLLTHNHHNMTQAKYRSIVEGLDTDNAQLLADTLFENDVPTLIMIEDPPLESKLLLDNLCGYVASISTQATKEVHCYITSRTKVLSDNFIFFESCCHREMIEGFDEEEAINYLEKGTTEERKSVYKIFTGLPLGLQAAKGYCKNTRIDYGEYLKLVALIDYDITDKEKEIINDDYGKNAEHVFQAIVMPFIPDGDSNTSALLQWKILTCISYFNYDRIPLFVLEYCCHMLRGKTIKLPGIQNKAEVGSLVTKLLDHGMCSETDENEITFHEVILNSFRLNNRPFLSRSQFNPLKKALEVMCGLVTKDMRKKDRANRMYKLKRHLQSLLQYIGEDESIFDDEADSILLQALTSHLHETTAVIMLNESPFFCEESGKHFERALELLWEDATQYTSARSNDQADNIAVKIVEEAIMKSNDLPEDFAVRYASKLEYRFDEDEMEFLKSKSKKLNGENRFKAVEINLKTQDSKEKLVKQLQECGVFLSNEKFRTVFYAERFAAILHSWSRVVVYAVPEIVRRDVEKCKWMSLLCRSVCVQCRTSQNAPQLIELLCATGGWFPLMLKQKVVSDVLKEALDACKTSLCNKEDRPMYENGLLKEVLGPSSIGFRVSVLRNIVRMSARLIRNGIDPDQEDADIKCQELFELAQKNAMKISSCIMCIIYCAKYYAVSGRAKQSFDCFAKFFELASECKPRFSVKCWAIYNYARAVVSFSSSNKTIKDAIQKCEEVLNTPIVLTKSLKDHLEKCLNNLMHMAANAEAND